MRVPMRVLEIKRGMFWGLFFKWRVREKDPSKVMKQLITWWLRGGQRTSRVGGQAGFQAPSRGQRDRCGRGKHSWMELLGRTFIFCP